MLLKVKHDELNMVQNNMKTDAEAYDVEINKMLEQIERLRSIWQGIDATTFCDNVHGYISKMKNIPIALRNMSKFIDKANGDYTNEDEAFGNELNTEAENYDE